jgi:DNA-binding SARP family transcriptional activator
MARAAAREPAPRVTIEGITRVVQGNAEDQSRKRSSLHLGSVMPAYPVPHAVPARFHLRLLGRFELRQGRQVLRISPAGERLLAYLGTRPEAVGRHALAAALWPDCADIRAAANLRSALHRLPSIGQHRLVGSASGGITLVPGIAVDVHGLAGQLAGDGPVHGPEAAVPVLRQDVLPDWPDEWLIGTREWFRQIRLRALERLSDQHRAAGRLDAALEAGLAAVACDPLRESAHRRLALIHIRDGNFADALRQYEVYRRLLRTELGLPPSAQFRKLMAPLLGRPADLRGYR